MAYFADLTDYRYGLEPTPWGADGPPALDPSALYSWTWHLDPEESAFADPEINVGWLDEEHAFPRSEPDARLVSGLEGACRATRYHLTRGYQECPCCGYGYGLDSVFGKAEIRVQGTGVVYAAPSLISHYVKEHEYAPPEEFVRWVIQSQGKQARPAKGTRRAIPAELLARYPLDLGALQRYATDLLSRPGRSFEVRDLVVEKLPGGVSISVVINCMAGPLARKWAIPVEAFLSVEQGAYGIASMVSRVASERAEQVFNKRLRESK